MKLEKFKMDTDSSSESASVPAKVQKRSKRLRRDSERKGERTVKRKRSNTLLSMIRDRSSSESDNDDKKIAPGSTESRKESKSQTSKGNHSGTESHGFVHEETIKREKSSSDTDSSASIRVSGKDTEQKSVLRRRNSNSERNHIRDKKRSNILQTMIDGCSSSSEEDNKIVNHSAKSLGNAKLKKKSKAAVRRIETSSDTEEEHKSSGSRPLSNNHSSVKQGKTLKGNKSLKLEDTIKSEILSSDSDTSSNVAKSKPEVLKEIDTRAEKDGEQKSKMLLSMIHDSSDDSVNEAENIADSSAKSLEKKNLKIRESGVRKTMKTNNEKEERQSSVSLSKSRKTLTDYWSKPQKRNKNSSENKSDNSTVGGIVKSEDCSMDEDSKDPSRKERKRKTQKTSAKAKSSNLLAMIDDNSSNSDRDDKKIKIEVDSDDSENNTNLRRRIRFDGSDAESSDDNNETKSLVKKSLSNKSRNFDLEVEAEDLAHLINVMEEEEMVPRESLTKMRNLDIKLQHKVPPQHMVETCAGSRGPTHEQKDIIEKFGPIKYGKYAPEEDDTIVDNWKSFCKVHDWDVRDVKPFLCMRHQYNGFIGNFSNRQKFVQYLANGLPWRTLYSVYWRFRNLYRPHLASRYTEDEDKLIIAHMENNSSADTKNKRKFSELSKILNRTRASVWRRYRLLKRNRDLDKKPQYDLHLAKKMIKNLIQLMLVKDVSGLKDLDIPLAVWNKLTKKFGIENKNLKQFWLTKLHMQLFCKEPIYLNDVKIKMIEYFYVSGITEWWEIEWANIAKYFDGMTSVFLCKIFSNLVHDEGLEGEELSEIVKQLYEVKKPELQDAAMDKCLPRLVFKHGSLKLLDRDRK